MSWVQSIQCWSSVFNKKVQEGRKKRAKTVKRTQTYPEISKSKTSCFLGLPYWACPSSGTQVLRHSAGVAETKNAQKPGHMYVASKSYKAELHFCYDWFRSVGVVGRGGARVAGNHGGRVPGGVHHAPSCERGVGVGGKVGSKGGQKAKGAGLCRKGDRVRSQSTQPSNSARLQKVGTTSSL